MLNPNMKIGLLRKGMIQIICGPMFSGKTTELLRRVRRYMIQNEQCLLLKSTEERYKDSLRRIVSHDQHYLEAHPCDKLYDKFQEACSAGVIGIDEGQFFEDIVPFSEELANRGKIVIIASLDSDFRREPFGKITELIAKAEDITKLTSICFLCKQDAAFSARITPEQDVVLIGGSEKYRPVCRACYFEMHNARHS